MNQRRILVVDDEPSIRFLLSAVLESHGYVVDTAEDGFAGLRAVQNNVPDLIITDLRMPNMNGFEFLSSVRQRFPELPTIAISGEFLACHISQGPLADAFFQKGSYSIPEFLGTISNLLARPAEERQQAPKSSVWRPTGDGPVMLTCTACLRSFPLEPTEGPQRYPLQVRCLFCDVMLDVQLVAVGLSEQG